MVMNGTPENAAELAFEHELTRDQRVQEEFDQLNQLLAMIDEQPAADVSEPSDPAWMINDYEVSRWRIVVRGNTRLDLVAQFRQELNCRDDIIDARVESVSNGEISIRLVTTGGIPMGPLERAVGSLTRDGAKIAQTG